MTVKATLAYGKSFHFYHEALDNNHVYLELEDVAYDAGYRRVMVAIPIDVWEVIRGLGAANLDLIEVSDEELMNLVERSVDARISEYERIRAASPDEAEQLKYTDAMLFGAMDAPRHQQLTRGVEYYKMERDRQREVNFRIAQHKIIDINTKPSEAERM